VADTSSAGDGFPDLVVGHRCQCGRLSNTLLEIKSLDQPPSKRRLTPIQVIFHRDWRGKIAVVHTIDEALDALCLN